jgi:hypothetical protein
VWRRHEIEFGFRVDKAVAARVDGAAGVEHLVHGKIRVNHAALFVLQVAHPNVAACEHVE